MLCCMQNFGFGQSEEEIVRNVFQDFGSSGLHEGIPYYALNQEGGDWCASDEDGFYLDEKWEDAVVWTNTDEKYKMPARMDIKFDQVQINVNGMILALLPDKVKLVAWEEKVFVPMSFELKKGGLAKGLFEVKVQGDVSLFLRYQVISRQAESHPVLGNPSGKMIEEIKTTPFYQNNDRALKKLKRNKAGVMEALGRRRKAVNEYARENEIGWRTIEDLEKLFTYYNRK